MRFGAEQFLIICSIIASEKKQSSAPNTYICYSIVNPSQQRYDYFYSHANIFKEK